MIKLVLLTLLGCAPLGGFPAVGGATTTGDSAQHKDYDFVSSFPQVLSITTSRQTASKLSPLGDILYGDSHRIGENEVHLKLVVHEQQQLQRVLEIQQEQEQLPNEETMTLKVLNQDDDMHKNIRRQLAGIDGSELGLDLSCYRTVSEVRTTLNNLATQYPDYVTVDSIGTSYSGASIPVLILDVPSASTSVTEKANVILVGGHHSRELPPPEILVRFVKRLLESYGPHADITWILERTRLHVIPLANPDGRVIVQNHLPWYYRKNAHPTGCNYNSLDGVDLNRNYPMFWGLNSGSSNAGCDSDYRGTGPLSEPESAAVFAYVSGLFSEERRRGSSATQAELNMDDACPSDSPGLFIDLHSWGDFIYFPWGHDDIEAPDHVALLTLSAKLAKAGDYSLWGPGQDGFLYYVSGDASDATYGINCVASVGYEIGQDGFYPVCSSFEKTMVPTVHKSLLYALKTAHRPYLIPLGPDVVSMDVVQEGSSSLTLTATVSDDAMIVDHAIFDQSRSQAIAGVSVFVDIHPDDDTTGDKEMVMSAADGVFNSVDETAVYTMDTSDWDVGQHTLYVQATDADGNTGAVSAMYVTIIDEVTSQTPSPTENPTTSPTVQTTTTRAQTPSPTGSIQDDPTLNPTFNPSIEPSSTLSTPPPTVMPTTDDGSGGSAALISMVWWVMTSASITCFLASI